MQINAGRGGIRLTALGVKVAPCTAEVKGRDLGFSQRYCWRHKSLTLSCWSSRCQRFEIPQYLQLDPEDKTKFFQKVWNCLRESKTWYLQNRRNIFWKRFLVWKCKEIATTASIALQHNIFTVYLSAWVLLYCLSLLHVSTRLCRHQARVSSWLSTLLQLAVLSHNGENYFITKCCKVYIFWHILFLQLEVLKIRAPADIRRPWWACSK